MGCCGRRTCNQRDRGGCAGALSAVQRLRATCRRDRTKRRQVRARTAPAPPPPRTAPVYYVPLAAASCSLRNIAYLCTKYARTLRLRCVNCTLTLALRRGALAALNLQIDLLICDHVSSVANYDQCDTGSYYTSFTNIESKNTRSNHKRGTTGILSVKLEIPNRRERSIPKASLRIHNINAHTDERRSFQEWNTR